METLSRSTHPLILVAAVSVSLASLAAAAHFTGLIPARTAEPIPLAAVPNAIALPAAPASIPAPPAATIPAPLPAAPAQIAVQTAPAKVAAKPRAQRAVAQTREAARAEGDEDWSGSTRRVAHHEDAGIDVIPARPAPVTSQAEAPVQAAPVCRDCGTVEAVQEIEAKGEGSGLGAIAGGVIGGLLGNQIGGGRGRNLATIAGAVGGAYAGHQVEKNVRSEKQTQVTVRFDDGSVRSFTQTGSWRNGDRVRLSNGALASL
jgi:outer membrane lipoprotein SlyB